MANTEIINEFREIWKFSRGLTFKFIETVPDEKWQFTPHERYSPLHKQFRHMVWVSGLYNEALGSGTMRNCESKKEHYSGDLTRGNILAGLRLQDTQLDQVLERITADVMNHKVEAFGLSMGFTEFTHVMLQHEAMHQGLWSLYAALGGFKTPKEWQENYGL